MSPSKKRKELEIELRRGEVANRYLAGKLQVEIAEELKISQATVSSDLTAIRERWEAQATDSIERLRYEQLAKIDKIEGMAAEAFAKSSEPAEEIIEEPDENGELKPVRRRRRGQSGNAAHLNLMLSCVERRCRLLGLDAPTKHAETDANGNDLSAEERADRARQMLRRHGYDFPTREIRPSDN